MKEESEKAGLKLNIQKINITTSDPITSWQVNGETMETVADYLVGLEGNGNPLSTLAWKISGTGQPGRLQSMGSLGVGHD